MHQLLGVMADAHWKQLIEDLRMQGYKSPYLERLGPRSDAVSTGQATLELEIVQEMASSLRATEDKLNVLLLRMELIEKELAASAPAPGASAPVKARTGDDPPASASDRIALFNKLREQALEARRNLAIHREAIGFRPDPRFDSHYPVPPKKNAP